MVDYRYASTGSTDLIIRDNGSTVEFWIDCRSASTWFGSGRPWSGRVNGVNVGGSFTWASGGGTRRIAGPWTVSTTQQVTFGIGNTQTAGMGGPASFSVTITRARPLAPTNLTPTRISDAQHRLDWSRPATYTSVVVQRRTDDGAWQQVGVAQGNAFTFTDSSTQANRKYEWRVAGVNAAGQSAWSGAVSAFTTPAAPTGVTAVRSGSNIVVSASGVPRWASSFEVRDGGTVVGTGGLPFTHVAPSPSTPHTYTVRGKVAGLDGAWSAPSNTVQLVAPPNAPVELRPNGSVVASGEPVRLSWRHNAVDSSAQSAAEVFIQLADNLGSTWTATTDQFVDMSSLSEGVHSWRVRTKGAHADWSPWSAVASLTVADRPGVAVLQPVDEWDSSVLTVKWSWFQAQGRPQSAWRYELLDASLTVREARTGSGAGTSRTLTTRLSEGVWTVRVQAATGDLWSPWATETFTVAFDPPGAPVFEGVWDESQGGVSITVAAESYGVAVLDGGVWYADIGV